MKVLYCTSEALPYIATGGLGDVAGSLPQALRQRLIGCRIVMPLYEDIPQHLRDEMKFVTSLSVPVAWRRQYCGVFEARYGGVIYYFIDNQYYFKRSGIYGHFDDAERFAFFSRAVLEMLPFIDFQPNIIHCNDWQTALVPIYYHLFYGHQEFYQNMKTLMTIHNIQYQEKLTLLNAFKAADDILRQGVQSISDLIKNPGIVNLDFADINSVMKDAGYAHMGVGRASGEDKARQAAERAISSPLLETSISGAMGVIINITSSPDIGLEEITIASEMIADMVHPDANIIWGTAFDESMEDEMSVTVIATGFSPEARALSAAAKAAETEKKQNDDLDLPLFGQANTTAPATRVDSQRKAAPLDEDDSYTDIMAIFGNKK